MGRKAKPAIDKVKDEIMLWPDEDAAELQEWLDMLNDVRERTKQAEKRRNATEGK